MSDDTDQVHCGRGVEGSMSPSRRACASPPSLGRFGRLLAIVAMSLVTATCYEVDQEIIDINMAEPVYGLPGEYHWDDGKVRAISTVPYSNEHRYRDVDAEGNVSAGSFRAIHLRDDIYIVQVDTDEGERYMMFFRFTSDKTIWQLMTTEAVLDLAPQYGVTIEVDIADRLYGNRDNILAFLRAHDWRHLEE